METTVYELHTMLANWQALAKEMQALGAAFDDEYAYGVLYGMQVCDADIKRLINQLTHQKVKTRTTQHTLLYSAKPGRGRKRLSSY